MPFPRKKLLPRATTPKTTKTLTTKLLPMLPQTLLARPTTLKPTTTLTTEHLTWELLRASLTTLMTRNLHSSNRYLCRKFFIISLSVSFSHILNCSLAAAKDKLASLTAQRDELRKSLGSPPSPQPENDADSANSSRAAKRPYSQDSQ